MLSRTPAMCFLLRTSASLVIPVFIALAQPATTFAEAGAEPGHEVFHAAGSCVQLILDRELFGEKNTPWTAWLETAIDAVGGVTGRYPAPRVEVVLKARPGDRPVTFGHLRRGDPPRVRFLVHPNAGLEELLKDWRGYHEFAHLLLPYPGARDIWFSEGLASYYQYLLMARAGVLNVEDAWSELAGGFKRGERDPVGRGRTLRELSPRMRRERAYRRVYWTGAAYFLRVDVRLRLESGGEHSLDSAIASFQSCCTTVRKRWNAGALIETLGAHSLAHVWEEEYRVMIDAAAEPDYADAFRKLGISRDRSGRLTFSTAHDSAELRRAIAAGG